MTLPTVLFPTISDRGLGTVRKMERAGTVRVGVGLAAEYFRCGWPVRLACLTCAGRVNACIVD